jgi:lipopolysaccharide transport system ATP-binding protein
LTVGIFSENHVKCFEATIPSVRTLLGDLPMEGTIQCQLPSVPLQPGNYFINAGLYSPSWDFVYDYHWQMHRMLISGASTGPGVHSGVVAIHPIWSEMPIKVERSAGMLDTAKLV